MEYKETQTFSADLTKELAPQIQGGNQAVTDTLAQALNGIDPQLSAFVVEGLKSPQTTQYAVDALIAQLNDQSAFQLMNQLAPITNNAAFYAFKNPQTESDPSLISPDLITEAASMAPHPLAAGSQLLEQGEVASAEFVKQLADHGAKTSADIEKGLTQFKNVLGSLEKIEVETEGDQGVVAMVVKHPAMPDMPVMTLVGEIDQEGIWRPEMEGFGVGTPAQARLSSILQQGNVLQALQQEYHVAGIEPIVLSLAETKPELRPARSTLAVEELMADPEFQAMSPEDQQGVLQMYFDEHVATDPDIANAIQQNPQALADIKWEYLNGSPIGAPPAPGSLVQRALEMTAGVFGNAFSAAAAGETLGATTQAAQLGSMALGAQPSILTPEQEASVRGVVGERGFSEGVGRTIADMALTPALGPVGAPLAMEALRGVNQAEQEGKPIYHSVSDTIKSGQHILSYTPQSQIGQAEQNVLRAYIIGKGVAVAFGGLVGLGVGSLAVGRWARNRLSGVAPEGVKEITQGASQAVRELFTTGEIPTGKIRELELAAAANNTSVNHEVNEAILKHTPAVVINPKTTKLTITMNNGQIADEGTFPKALKDAIEATAKGEPPPLQFGESAALREIASIEGPQNKVNAIFEQFGMGIRVVDGRAAKGLRVTRVGKEFSVIGADFKKRFTTAKEVRQFVNDYPLSSNRIEDAAYKDLLVQGKNGFYLTAEVVNHDAMVGNLSVTPNWQTVLQYFTSSLQPQTVRLKDVEARLGAPLHTRVVIPMERAYTEFRAFNQPYQDEITQLVKGIGKHGPGSKREGYVHLMAEEPGSSGWNDLIREYKLDPQKAEQFRSLFLRGSEEFGIDGNKLLTQIIPRVRETGSLEKAFPSGHLPKEAAFWADDVNFGNVPFAEGTEHDIEVLARSFFSQGGFTIKAGKAWREAVQIADELMTQPLPANARSSWETLAMQRQQQHTYLEHYLRSVKGWGDHSDEMAMRWLGVTMQKLSVGSDIPPHQVTQLGKKVYGAMYASNYAAHFGFRLSAIGKQWLQLVQSTYPHFGGPETTRAINSLFGKGGQAQRQRIAEAGALLDTPIMTEADAGPMADWLQWSGKGLSWADNFNRLVPGSAQLNLMRRYLPGYQAKAPKVAPRGVMPAQAMPPPIGPPAPPPFTGPMMPPGIRAGGVAMRPIQRAPAAKPPPTITNTHAMPKNYGTVSPTFQKQFPMGTEVTFEAAEAGGLRPVKGTVTGYIRTKSGAEHATVAEPGVPNGHVANVAMGLKRAGGPGAKPGPKGPGLRQRVMMLKEQREAEGFVESIRTEVPYSKKPLAIQAMEDADMQPVMIPNRTPPPPPEVPIAPDIPEPPGIFSPLWKQFAADTKIDHFNWQEQQQIKTLIDNGETEEAINVAIRKSVAKTQYLYDMPNRPPALHSVAGRFVGQYATFPLSYIQQFRDIFTGGTRTNAQRIAHATRWFAANALVKGSAAAILGAEMGNYVFFQPMIVSGGPRFNWWLEVPKIMTGFSHQSMLGHVEKALEGNIPGAGMGKDIYRMMTAQDLAGVGRAVLNVPPTKEEKKRLGGR